MHENVDVLENILVSCNEGRPSFLLANRASYYDDSYPHTWQIKIISSLCEVKICFFGK